MSNVQPTLFFETEEFSVYETNIKHVFSGEGKKLRDIESSFCWTDDETNEEITCPLHLYKDTNDVKNPDEVYIGQKTIDLLISYPLENGVIFKCHSTCGQFTNGLFISMLRAIYKKIYRVERKTSSIAPMDLPNMFNRNKTNGKYGIWGHHLGDLVFEGAYICDDIVCLEIGS